MASIIGLPIVEGEDTGLAPDANGIAAIRVGTKLAGVNIIVDPDDPTHQQKFNADGSPILPSTAATAAKQDAGNGSTASIDGKTPPLGQAVAAASVPVVLPAAQQAALTPPAAITNFAVETGGHMAAIDTAIGAQGDADTANTLMGRVKLLVKLWAGGLPAALSAGGNLKVALQESAASQSVTGSVSVSALPGTTLAGTTPKTADFDTGAGTDTVPMLGLALPKSGGAVIGGTSVDPIRTDPTGATTQPISVTTLPLPTGAAADGIDVTGASMPTGGSGIRGWLSALFMTWGTTADAAWNGSASTASAQSYLRYIGTKVEAIRALLPAALDGAGRLKIGATLKQLFGSAGQTITVSLASLANNAARAATALDFTSLLPYDVNVFIKIKTGASGVSSAGYVNVWAVGSVDGGATYVEGATGSDAAITLTSPTNAVFLGSINAVANASPYSGLFSLAQAFGGIVPAFVVIIVENKTGAALDGTEANHAKAFQAVYGQAA